MLSVICRAFTSSVYLLTETRKLQMQQQNHECVLYRIAWKKLSETVIDCASRLIYSQDDVVGAPRAIDADGTRSCGCVDVIQSQEVGQR